MCDVCVCVCVCVYVYICMCDVCVCVCVCVQMVGGVFLTQDAVDWVKGDRIVVAPTGKDGNETEVSILLAALE